ncbi:hypothetical protein [Actinomadura sp. 7K507]|uniref:hypothetical protein n=1 Tax=Actinomadura sp. 7K507 TaxID=2530365 RepID=UPI001A9E2AE6|nr:hypothetical protein [Actinomadura sp. 7K507]
MRVHGGEHGSRVSIAGMVCLRPGHRSRLIYRLHRYRRRKGERAGFLATDLDDLAGMIKHRLKVIQHHPGVIDGCLAPTGLTLNTTPANTN